MTRPLQQVARLVHAESGIVLKENQYQALRGAVGRAVGESDPAAFLRSASDPVAGPKTVARLIDEVSVGETYFLRDRDQLETIDWPALRAHADGGTIRVWSAACSSGEEAYSLALLAAEAFLPAPPPVRILATDISGAALEAARRGRYGPRALREIDAVLRGRYFHEQGLEYAVTEPLQECVSFARHNLVRDPVPPLGEAPFDVIVCRNVLIYFDAETVKQVLDRLEQALRPGGVLVLGAADTLCRTKSSLSCLAETRVARNAGRRASPDRSAGIRPPQRAPHLRVAPASAWSPLCAQPTRATRRRDWSRRQLRLPPIR